jgi:ArsR family transcriptional regulator, nickel/cobalt-responsive transcriptional repressor
MDPIITKLKALGDETRLSIVEALLPGPKNVSQIIPHTNKSQPTVSLALRQLLLSGVIQQERKGKNMEYCLIAPRKIKSILELLKDE